MMSESSAHDERRAGWREWIKRRVVKTCSAGLAGGSMHADYLVRLGMARERIFLGYDAVDNRYFEDQAAEIRKLKAESREKHGLPENFFLASARFVEKKNLPRLIKAYGIYREKAEMLPPAQGYGATGKVEIWDLVLLGDGPLRETLNSQLSALNLLSHVHLPGFKQYDELPAYYGLASAFVHASTTEQWGLVVNEAMASGLPVLVSNRCGCATDLVKEGINGFTFDPYNVEQLAQLMFRISAFQPFRLSAFGDASREIIAAWGPDRFARGLQQAVEVALKTPVPKVGWFDRLLLQLLLNCNRA